MSNYVCMEKCRRCQVWSSAADCTACYWRERLKTAQSEDEFEQVMSELPFDPYSCEEWDDNALPF